MSDDSERLEQKIDDHIERQEKSNSRVENTLERIAEHMSTFVGFQARAEERHSNYEEFKTEIKTSVIELKTMFVDFKEKEFVPVRDAQRDNSKMTNYIGIVSSLLVGSCITAVVMKMFGS